MAAIVIFVEISGDCQTFKLVKHLQILQLLQLNTHVVVKASNTKTKVPHELVTTKENIRAQNFINIIKSYNYLTFAGC